MYALSNQYNVLFSVMRWEIGDALGVQRANLYARGHVIRSRQKATTSTVAFATSLSLLHKSGVNHVQAESSTRLITVLTREIDGSLCLENYRNNGIYCFQTREIFDIIKPEEAFGIKLTMTSYDSRRDTK